MSGPSISVDATVGAREAELGNAVVLNVGLGTAQNGLESCALGTLLGANHA